MMAHASALNESDCVLQRQRDARAMLAFAFDAAPTSALRAMLGVATAAAVWARRPLVGVRERRLALCWPRLGRLTWSRGHGFYNFKGLRFCKRECDPVRQLRHLAGLGSPDPNPALINIASLIGGGLRALTGNNGGTGERRSAGAAVAALPIAAIVTLVPCLPAEALEVSNLGEVHQVDPIGSMRGFVVLFSDAAGWTSALDVVAAALAQEGALVVGVDLPSYLKTLDTHLTRACHDGVGDIESISRRLQRERGNASYLTPIVAGVGEGGALAAVLLAQAPAVTIAGAIAYNPTVSVHTRVPLCSTPPATTQPDGGFAYGPWSTLPGFWVVGFTTNGAMAAGHRLAAQKRPGSPVDLVDVAGLGPAAALAALLDPHLAPVANPPAGGVSQIFPWSNCLPRRADLC
jgi:hypothetical protein